eukprot:5349207-Alexandrium_andersonii.AAC.1
MWWLPWPAEPSPGRRLWRRSSRQLCTCCPRGGEPARVLRSATAGLDQLSSPSHGASRSRQRCGGS